MMGFDFEDYLQYFAKNSSAWLKPKVWPKKVNSVRAMLKRVVFTP